MQEWWAKWPDANIGIATGEASGIFVVDVDGPDGEDALHELCEDPLPDTVEVLTGRGRHLYFRTRGLAVTSRQLAPQLDVKGEGGFVVSPPSTHASGRSYEWEASSVLGDIPIADPPEWLKVIVGSARKATSERPRGPIPEGQRNSELMSIAGRLRRAGLDVSEIEATLGAFNSIRCVPPLGDEEVQGIAQSVTRYPAGPDHGEGDSQSDDDGSGAEDDGAKRSHATKLLVLAEELLQLGRSDQGEAFAVVKDGPNVALMIGGRRRAIRAVLASAYMDKYGRVPPTSALEDALQVLEGRASRLPMQRLHTRLASHVDGVVIDLGEAVGRAVFIRPGTVDVLDRSPVLFRRSELTGTLPVPVPGAPLDVFKRLVNINDATWPLALGYLIAALLPDMPHPIALVTGEQGTGKSTAAKYLTRLVDPSPADLRQPPGGIEDWVVAAGGSWVVSLDNVSGIPPWLSDALCRAVTGEGLVRRALYTNDDLSVISFRRVVMLTSIDPGALRGDLAERLVTFELERIDETSRADDAELEARFRGMWPELLQALYALVASVMEELPKVTLTARPRMSDFAKVLAALDRVLGTTALATYLDQLHNVSADVVEADAVAAAVQDLIEGVPGGTWHGTATELLDRLTRDLAGEKPPKGWPATPSALSSRLARLAPALRRLGIDVERKRVHGGNRIIDLILRSPSPPSPPSPKSQGAPPGQAEGLAAGGGGDDGDATNHAAGEAMPAEDRDDHEEPKAGEGR